MCPYQRAELVQFPTLDLSCIRKVFEDIGLDVSEMLTSPCSHPSNFSDQQSRDILVPALVQGLWACRNDVFRSIIERDLALLDPFDQVRFQRLIKYLDNAFDQPRFKLWQSQKEQREREVVAEHLVFFVESAHEFVLALNVL